jgi:hypothetical protein
MNTSSNCHLDSSDRIVRRIDDYPELSKALREGDVSTARQLCAALFSGPQDRKDPMSCRPARRELTKSNL